MILVITLIDMQKERFVHFSDQFLCAYRRSYGPEHEISNAPNLPKVLKLSGGLVNNSTATVILYQN